MLWLLVIGVLPHLADSEGLQNIFPVLDISSFETSGIGGPCSKDLQLLRDGIQNRTLWAMRMLDASAQGTSGLLYGSTWQLGNFDECVAVGKPMATQYCLPVIKATKANLTADPDSVWSFVEASHDPSSLPRDVLHTAVCIPKSCTSHQLQAVFQAQLDSLLDKDDVQYTVTVDSVFCTASDEREEFGFSEIAFWGVCILTLIATALGTFICAESDSRLARFFKCFSFKANVRGLMEASDEESSHSMSVLHGIKVASMIFIVYGHRFGLVLILAIYNYEEVEAHRHTAHNLFILQADLVVDSFFLISGVVATYFMCQMFEKRTLSVPKAIFARVCRLAPSYYMLVWFQASSAYRIGSGPVWKAMQGAESKNCAEYWWANLFFINNYLPAENICLVHSWFIPCDLHFFLLACLLVTLLVRQPKFGLGLLIVLTVLAPVIPALTSYFYNLEPVILFYDAFLSNPRSSQVYDMLYVKSHNRVAVYLVGICVGYFLHKRKDSKYTLSKWLSLWAGILGVCLMFTSMALGGLYYEPVPPGPTFSAIFAALRRPIWGIGLSIILIAHRFGPKNALSSVMSSRAAIVLSKLTFGVYLIHFVLILSQVSMTRSPYPFTVYSIMIQGLEDTSLCFLVAAFLYVLFELPIKRIIREVLFAKKVKEPQISEKKKPEEVYSVKL